MADSQEFTLLSEVLYDDPSQLSQALRQRAGANAGAGAGNEQGLHFTTSTESRASAVSALPSTFTVPPHPLLGVIPQLLPTAPEQAHAHAHSRSARRAAADSTTRTYHVKPGLTKHNSAPVEAAPMDGAIAPKMYHSFAGMDAPGDTQPDSQMHRDWTSGIFGTAETFTKVPSPHAGPKSLFVENEDEDDDDGEPFTDGVDVIVSSQPVQHVAITSPTALEDDREASLRTAEAFTSPLKFETPALAGRNRNSSVHMRSSTADIETTPDTAASASAFGGAFGVSGIGQPLSLTQAFDLTQARTSPVVAGTEDPIFQRPSPNFQHLRHSSPVPAQSSPIKVMRNGRSDPIIRSSSEPRSEYVTMKESQERRKLAEGAHPPHLLQEDSWEELSVVQKRLQRKRQREQAHRAASLSLSSVSAPLPDMARSARKHGGRAQDSLKPSPRARHAWHHGMQEDEDVAMDDPSQRLVPEADEAANSPDSSPQDDTAAAHAPMKYRGLENGVQVPKTSSHPQRTQPDQTNGHVVQQATPSSQMQRVSQVPASASQSILRTAPHSSRGSVAVMDSQPDMNTNYESWPRPDMRFPSSPSVNQYSINQTTVASRTGYTSQMVSSSMVPMPPRVSPSVEEDEALEQEERVPSSPPMLTNDLTNELTYDEHGYDEHSEADADQEVNDMVHAEGDVRIEEEEDLPVADPSVVAEERAVTTGTEQDADVDSEVNEPRKVDGGTDDEVPETLEEEEQRRTTQARATEPPIKFKADSSGLVATSLQRQNTVPETDALDETQPSYFAEPAIAAEGNTSQSHAAQGEAEVSEHTNGTEPFQTAPQHQTEPHPHMPDPNSSRDDNSDPIHDVKRIRSLNDIANLPNTQRSAGEDDIVMPTFIGFENADGDTHMDDLVFATPAAKRRKIAFANDDDEKGTSRGSVETAAVEGQEQETAPSPLRQLQQQRDETPPTASAKEREDRGALAAEQAREEFVAAYGRPAALKSRGSRPARPTNSKKGSLNSARAAIATMSSPIASPSKPKAAATAQKPAPTTPSRKFTTPVETAVDVEMRDAGDSTDELTSSPPPSATPLPVRLTPRKLEVDTSAVVVPKRVFASWPGSHYYPATCIGRTDSKHLKIRFDDGNTTSLEAFLVRSLELHPGDQVKVDEAGKKKNTYVVVGVTDKCEDLHNYEFPLTDRYGNVSVILEEKQRESLLAGREVPQPKHVKVYIANVYLTSQLWNRLRNRTFELSPPSSPEKAASHLGTPVAADASTTPSFTRRGLAVSSFLKDATNRAGSVASSIQAGSGTFSNMAFVLTSTGDAMDKDAVARAIKTNGGRVLEHGFHELFDTASIEVSASQSRRTSISDADIGGALTLKEDFKKLGFVALITDSHSRSTKYLQALALNVPCLHLRWVHDSLAASHALGFARYLLPAGLSKYLDPAGTVRSRAMRIYNPAAEDVLFERTSQARELLLQDQAVLLVTGKSKKEMEKRQPFVFLTHALGAANVGRCADVTAAAQFLAQGGWDWVFVDGEHGGVADAAASLFGAGAAPVQNKKPGGKKGKKRKRDDGEVGELFIKGDLAGIAVKVACAEFVIQSLILGALVDE
ncbi:hypothetical protein B5807_08753 [Epicoccum nigrum]|uniref:BRCT domain-containing protein n=1 Tax=Epicoccum nigrum TaxID=105696 RepID=A0A1Y2LSV2_EPING|nr:hypothetical protein B5807_08753 [Epicoccum nigrum]